MIWDCWWLKSLRRRRWPELKEISVSGWAVIRVWASLGSLVSASTGISTTTWVSAVSAIGAVESEEFKIEEDQEMERESSK